MKRFVTRHGFLLAVIAVNLLILVFSPPTGERILVFSGKVFANFLLVLTPVFICVGLLDVWVDKQAMQRIMGEKSGVRGVLVAFFLGMVTAIPVYALLPVAGLLLKKGGKIANVLIFVCSCTSIRIPLLLFEAASMGVKFTAVRFIANVFAVVIIAYTIDFMLTGEDKQGIYDSAAGIL